MRWRSFAVANSLEDDLLEEKQVPTRKLIPSQPVRIVSEPSLGWVFTGQGAQYVDMGRELIAMYPVFEETLTKVDEVYKGLGCIWSIFGKWADWTPLFPLLRSFIRPTGDVSCGMLTDVPLPR